MLSACPYFYKMLQGSWRESKNQSCHFEGVVDHHVFHDFIAYLYTSRISVNYQNVISEYCGMEALYVELVHTLNEFQRRDEVVSICAEIMELPDTSIKDLLMSQLSCHVEGRRCLSS